MNFRNFLNTNIVIYSVKVSDLVIDDEYIVVKAEAAVVEIAEEITNSGIPDAVVVDDEGNVLGALDDFDIVSKVVAKKLDPLEVTAKDIMYAPPPVKLETEVKRAEEIMKEMKASMLPVVNNERKLLGVVTIMDVLEAREFEEIKSEGFFTSLKRLFS